MVVVGDFYVILVIAGLVDVFEQAPHIFLLLCVIGGVLRLQITV
jgi:threonine/homoserine/homoserine lactone efflux protein